MPYPPTNSIIEPTTTIMRLLLTNELSVGLAASATATSTAYPVFEAVRPDQPDKCLMVFDAADVSQGRYMLGGARIRKLGCMVQVRNPSYLGGYEFANSIVVKLTESGTGLQLPLTLQPRSLVGYYNIYNVEITSGPVYVGIEPENRRHLWSINSLLTLDYISG